MRKWKVWLLSALCAIVVLLFCVFYARFVSERIFEESSNHLTEIYSQVDHVFSTMVANNWNLLDDWSGYIQHMTDAGEQGDLEEFIRISQTNWDYTDFCFLDFNGNYITLDGQRGQLILSHQLTAPVLDSNRAVVNGTLSTGEAVTVFAVYIPAGQYQGFDYTSIAISYDETDLALALDVAAFDRQANCYVVSPDGHILFSSGSEDTHPENYIDYLDQNAMFRQGSVEAVRESIRGAAEGVVEYELDGTVYYMAYLPVGFQDWMLLGVVPERALNANINQIQWVTVALMSGIFLAAAAIVTGHFGRHVRKSIQKRDVEIQYRDLLFDTLVNTSTDIFVMFSAEGYQVDYVSPNIEELLGVPVDLLRQNIRHLSATAMESTQLWAAEELRAIPFGAFRQEYGRRIHQKTGEQRLYQETVYHLILNNAEKYILVMSDHTLEQEVLEQLEQALTIAQNANDAKSAFLSNMSHDIRTPMNAIVGFAKLLMRDAEQPEKVREYTRKISAAGTHLLGLINDILDMSKIESGKTSLNMTEFMLGELLEGLNTVIQPQVRAKGQSFVIKVRKVPHERFLGDLLRINQILLNLLSNAVKYTGEGGEIELYVTAIPQASRNYSHLRFRVRDTGIGMSPEFLNVIFEPFSRAQNSTASGIQGTGLGMAITKNLVDLMGGSISVESQPGVGSTFAVELELRIVEQAVEQDFWKKHRIARMLLVDDEEDLCKNIQYLMEDSGVDVSYTTSGAEAAELACRAAQDGTPFDLILLDWRMPGVDGAEATRRIRANVSKKTTPILAFSAYDRSEIEAEAQAAGADGFLPKPFFISNLHHAIHEMQDGKAEAESTEAGGALSGLHFLVAEDNEINAEILIELLDMEGATCEVAENGKLALERFEQAAPGTYHMILMDVQMPVMGGYDAARAIRASEHPEAQTIPIAAMTANAFAEDVRKAMESGMDAHIVKPVDMDVLTGTVKKLLAQGARTRRRIARAACPSASMDKRGNVG